MKKSLLILGIVCLYVHATSQINEYRYTVDLTNVVNDRLFVEVETPAISRPELQFNFPKIIPGTYSIEDYGRFVSDLKAYDKKGKRLEVKKINDNSWTIKNANKLVKLTYWIDDSFDSIHEGPEIFEPAGTNIEANNFLINNSGFFGYLDGMKDLRYTINIIRDKDFYGSTGLIPVQTNVSIPSLKKETPGQSNKAMDVFRTENYDELVDSPLMYSRPDTAVIKIGNAEVLIGSYSPNKKISAKEIAASVKEVLIAQKEFLGGKLPVEKYAFILYFTDKGPSTKFGFGALEHSYSSVYFFPELNISMLKQNLYDVAAHEFFHIVTPLTIHSEEIHRFDFNDPKMSKHLWLYEGMTEYFSGLVQVKYDLVDSTEYLNMVLQKIQTASQYLDDVPFTDISKFTLEKYNDQYGNVYQKGALIGLCLDVKLRELSGSKYGVQNLITELSKKYGKNQAFNDDELFDQIVSLTYPQIGEFLSRYVAGPEPLPLSDIFNSVGIKYVPGKAYRDFTTGLETRALKMVDHKGKKMFAIANPDDLNDQGKLFEFKAGDMPISINGIEFPELGPQTKDFFERAIESVRNSGTIHYKVLRANDKGELKEIELTAPVKEIERMQKPGLDFDPDASQAQLALRNAWLSK